jgi:intergrase/recombinase
MRGIQYVQDQRISITNRSVKTLKAYRNYCFVIDKNGVIINEPNDTIHEWSNPMDAIRYGLESFKPKKDYIKKVYIPNNSITGW